VTAEVTPVGTPGIGMVPKKERRLKKSHELTSLRIYGLFKTAWPLSNAKSPVHVRSQTASAARDLVVKSEALRYTFA
jgi:hypothetical protein